MINLLAQAIYDRIKIIDGASFVLFNSFCHHECIVVGPAQSAAAVAASSWAGAARTPPGVGWSWTCCTQARAVPVLLQPLWVSPLSGGRLRAGLGLASLEVAFFGARGAFVLEAAAVPQTSKTKQFCETSSIFEVGNIKNEAILRDLLQNWKVECKADGLVPMCFAIFPLHLHKVLRLPCKSDARSYEVLHLSRKIILANLQIWCSKMQPLSRNQRPKLLTSLMNMSLVLRLPREIHLCKSSANLPRLPSFLDMLQNPHGLLTFGKVQNPLRLPRKTTPEPSKVVEHALLLTFWLWNVLRATTACTFSTSQLPKVVWTWCFVHVDFEMCFAPYRRALFQYLNFQKCPQFFYTFDFEMCFAPQRRALFRHLNFQKWSEHCVLCTFWLGNVLRATTACNFLCLTSPHGSTPAALASLLFDPPEPEIIGKTQCFATFLPFRAPAFSFFWLFLFLWLFPPLLFHLSILSEVWLLNFLRLF